MTASSRPRSRSSKAATIDTYIKRIRRKLGLGDKADLTRRAVELGETDDDP